jgi:hypothetical protein
LSLVGEAGQTDATIAWTPADAADSRLVFTTAGGEAVPFTVTDIDAAGYSATGLAPGTAYTVVLEAVANDITYYRDTLAFSTAASSGPVNRFWNISDYTGETLEFTANTPITPGLPDGLTALAAAGKAVSIDSNNKSMDDYSFTRRIKMGGVSDDLILPTNRALKFDVAGNCTITVYGMSGSGGSARTFYITDGATQLASLENDGNALGKLVYDYDGGAKTLYITVGAAINFYGVGVDYP